MNLTLGIDTGGTFTDAVLWDKNAKKVLQKSKAFTVPDDLTKGMDACISKLKLDNSFISDVHLSTTLTVNSILEDQPSKVGLVLIGKHLTAPLPVCQKYEILKDDMDKNQKAIKFSNQEAQHIRQLFSEGVSTVIVSANGKDYRRIESIAAEALRKLLAAEIICCSALSSHKELYDRTLAAATTVGLKPIITEWTIAIENTMKKYGIHAPIKMLTGSGAMISLKDAASRPLDTIMSGPTASFFGSTWLTEQKDYLLLDMGGTSLDITRVKSRTTRFSENKTAIGKYNYRIKTLDLQTFGTGGDSKIKLNGLKEIVIGPQKVMPLCVLGAQYSHLTSELQAFRAPQGYDLCTAEETDCYFASHNCSRIGLQGDAVEIVRLLSDKPHSLFYLADYFGKDADALHMDQLLEKGCIRCASLTPTDILHAEGVFDRWNSDIAKACTHILAERKGYKIEVFIKEVKALITKQLSYCCMQSIAGFENKPFLFSDCESTMYLIEKYLNQQDGLISSFFSIQKPIVGIGAPAKAWLGKVAEKLSAQLILPADGDVAGAIGAAAGKA